MMRRLSAALLAVCVHGAALAQGGEPKYAINQFHAEGSRSVVRSATISLLPIPNRTQCELTLRAFRESAALQPTVKIDNQACVVRLPQDLAPVVDGAPIAGAVYVKYTYTAVGMRNTGWDITWLGAASAKDFCSRALVRYRAKYEDAVCVGPG